MKSSFESQYEFGPNKACGFARGATNGAARACVVNRTHRVVRERARALQQRRSRARSLMAPLIVCSVLLLLTGFAIWSGLYQYSSAETASVDSAAVATYDVGNQLTAVLLWFVPVSLTLLATVLYRRSHKSTNHEAM